MKRFEEIYTTLVRYGKINIDRTLQKFDITERTLRDDLKLIKERFVQNRGRIVKQQNYYCLNDLQNQQIKEWTANKNIDFNNRLDRIAFLKTTIIDAKQPLLPLNLQKQMFISSNVFRHDLNDLKNILKKENLILKRNKDNKIAIEGDERDVRHLLAQDDDLQETKDFQLMEELLSKKLDEHQIIIAPYIIEHLAIFCFLSVRRHDFSYRIKDNWGKLIENEKEKQFFNDFLQIINIHFNVELNNAERKYLLVAFRSYLLFCNQQEADNLSELMNRIIFYLKENYTVNLIDDKKQTSLVYNHLAYLRQRIFYNIKILNPWLMQTKLKYPYEYQMARDVGLIVSDWLEGQLLDEGEIGYLCFHIISKIRMSSSRNGLIKAYLISSMPSCFVDVLKLELEQQFEQITIVEVLSFMQFEKIEVDENALIICTRRNAKVKGDNVAVVDGLLCEMDVIEIRRVINRIMRKKFNLFYFFDQPYFEDKFLALDFLKANFQNEQRAIFIDSLIADEHISNSWAGDFAAIPHVLGKKNEVMCCFFKNGINWDDEKVYFVFLICISKSRNKEYAFYFNNVWRYKKHFTQKCIAKLDSVSDICTLFDEIDNEMIS